MNKFINILSSIIWVLLPFVFIGSAYLVIPEFERLFEDMIEGQQLPKLTEIIVSPPRHAWLLIAVLFAILNYYISKKEKNALLSICSTIAMLLISGTIVIGLFLPVTGHIMVMRNLDSPQASEPDGRGQ